MEELKNEQRETALVQIDSIWRRVSRVNAWQIVLSVMLLASVVGNFRLNYIIERNRSNNLEEGVASKLLEDDLRLKLGYNNETIAVMRGILRDDPQYLELAKTKNHQREGNLEFIHWNNPDSYVESMMRGHSVKCIEWVMRQPEWQSCLNTDVYSKLLDYAATASLISKAN
tara:strand:+ start:555 stop:1067 length:513 start_codon:yes stop_codon:yes gene_type:complete